MTKALKSILVPILVLLISVSMAACNKGSDSAKSDPEKVKTAEDSLQTAQPQSAPKAEVKAPAGWNQASHENYTFVLPQDWKADGNTGIWHPEDQSKAMGRPKVSLHCGSIPPRPGGSIEDNLKFYYNTAPVTKETSNKCGKQTKYLEVTARGYKHLGLITIEDLGPMKVIDFFDCRAPKAEFDKYQQTFKKILDSVECR